MFRAKKDQAMHTSAPNANVDHVANMAAMTGRLGLDTVPAAWPTGVSHLAQAIDACQRCDAGEVCADWLGRASDRLMGAPPFCPNAPAFNRLKQAKEK